MSQKESSRITLADASTTRVSRFTGHALGTASPFRSIISGSDQKLEEITTRVEDVTLATQGPVAWCCTVPKSEAVGKTEEYRLL
jgi:hypothetical protein